MLQSPAQFESNVLTSIWRNDLEQLEKNLKLFDVNKMAYDLALCAAERLNRTQCKQLLIKYHANQAFAKLHSLIQDYCLLFPPSKSIRFSNQLSDKSAIHYKISSAVRCTSYGVGLIAKEFQHYAKKNLYFKSTQEMLSSALENYYSETAYNAKAIFERIKKGKTTLINTGWHGTPSHIISVIIHQDHLIVGDGLKAKINIFPIKPNMITQKMIDDLLTCPQGSNAHQALIKKIVGNKEPSFQLDTETQNNNCAIFSHLSALQGLWFLLNVEKNFSIKEAAYQAKKQRTDFDHFMKQSVLKRVAKNKKAKELLKEILPRKQKKGSSYSGAMKFGLGLAIATYIGITLATGVFFNIFVVMGLLGGLGLGGTIFSLIKKTSSDNLLPANIPVNKMSCLVQREQKNTQYLNLWLTAQSEDLNSNDESIETEISERTKMSCK